MSSSQCRSISSLRPMISTDLQMVLNWRNTPEVRQYMFNSNEITLDVHEKWFERVKNAQTQHLLIYEENGEPLGFMNLNNNGTKGIVDWGFYVRPNSKKGTGRRLGETTLDYVFNEMQLHKVCGQVLAFNKKSIGFHKSIGFDLEGVLKKQHHNGYDYCDVYYFGLIKSDWLKLKELLK